MPHTDHSSAAYLEQLNNKHLRLHSLLSEFNAPAPLVFA